MPLIYVAASKSLAEWGAGVGLTKSIYKLGLTDLPKEKIVEALNAERHAGRDDWKLVKSQSATATDESEIVERVARRERLVSPDLYPGIRGAPGVFKVKLENVENHLVVQAAMADQPLKNDKVKPGDIAVYLITLGTGAPSADDEG